MYLYFGKDGKLKTKINHDAPPRQGGDLNVTVCLDMDFWDNYGINADKFYSKSARVITPDNKEGFPQTQMEGVAEVFDKLYNSEIVYDLIPGKSYLTYKFRYPANNTTAKPGNLIFALSATNYSLSSNNYVRIGSTAELATIIPKSGEKCVCIELNSATNKIDSATYKIGDGVRTFGVLGETSFGTGTSADRAEILDMPIGYLFVQQDKVSNDFYGEITVWAVATKYGNTLEWVQLQQFNITAEIPESGTIQFGAVDINIERTTGYARTLIDQEISIKYQDIMDEFKRVYSKIAIAGTKPDWNVPDITSPAYIYNKPNVKTILAKDIDLIRETGVYIVKNNEGNNPIKGDYVLVHEKQEDNLHMQIVRENQNVLWFRSFEDDKWSGWGEKNAGKEYNNLEAKLNENIAINPNKTYILFHGKSIKSTSIDNNAVYDVDYGDGSSEQNSYEIQHDYTDDFDTHIITVTSYEYFKLDSLRGETENDKIKVLYFAEGIISFELTGNTCEIGTLVLPSTTAEIKNSFGTVKTTYCKFINVPNIDENSFGGSEGSQKIFVKKSVYNGIVENGNWLQYANKIYYDIDSSDLSALESSLISIINSHVLNTENPHKVTKDQIGLDKVENYSPENMPLSTEAKARLDDLEKRKLDKATTATTYGQVYYKNADGSNSVKFSTPQKLSESIVERDENGRAKITAPESDDDIANKGYTDSQDKLRIAVSEKGEANGVATLGDDKKIPLDQIPESIAGGLVYGGTFTSSNGSLVLNLSTAAVQRTKKKATCTPVNAGTGANDTQLGYEEAQGLFFKVKSDNIAFAGETYDSGDLLMSTLTSWDKIDNTDKVNSVNGETGDVKIPAIQYDKEQNLSENQQATARDNLDVYSKSETDGNIDLVWNYIEDSSPVLERDLLEPGFTPSANTYYKHSGATENVLKNGVIYFYNGKYYKPIDGEEEIYIGDEEPEDKAKLWIDTSAETPTPSVVRANPALSATAPVLTGLNVDGQGYKVPSYTVDSFLSEESSNAVMNSVVTVHLNEKLDKATNKAYEIYAHNGAEQTKIPVGTEPSASIVMLTDDNGYLKVKDPVSNDNPVNKKTLDALDEKKMDKAGGAFTGDVSFQKDIYVAGTAVYENQQSLGVKDPVIVTNVDGETLNSILSGLAIRKDPNKTYGIMYDPADDTVKFGEGTLVPESENSETKRFSFNDGEGHALAIRADSSNIADTRIIVWDSTKKMFVDGGKTIPELLNVVISETEPEQSEEMPEIWVDPTEEADLGNLVYANPALGGSEPVLKSLQIGVKKYKIPQSGKETIAIEIPDNISSGSLTTEQIELLRDSDAHIIQGSNVFRKYAQDETAIQYESISFFVGSESNSLTVFYKGSISINLSSKTFSTFGAGNISIGNVKANPTDTPTDVLNTIKIGSLVLSVAKYYNHKVAFKVKSGTNLATTFPNFIYINCISSNSGPANSVASMTNIFSNSYGSINGFTTTNNSIMLLYNHTTTMLVFMESFAISGIRQIGLTPESIDESSITDTVLAL